MQKGKASENDNDGDDKREIIRKLLNGYDIQTAQDIQAAVKDLLGGTLKEMMSHHPCYEKSERSDSDNAHNFEFAQESGVQRHFDSVRRRIIVPQVRSTWRLKITKLSPPI